MRLVIAARQSHLARLQAFEVAAALQKKNPQLDIEFHFRESLGDKNLHEPLWKMPEKGVFTEDFVEGLRKGEFDLVVHSWKDLPVESREGLELIACLPRADQRDLLLVKKATWSRVQNQKKLCLYTSSPRRTYNLKNLLPQLLPGAIDAIDFESVRGNVPTRLRKMLENPVVDGLIVAKAAMDRLMSLREGEEWAELHQHLKRTLEQCDWMVLPLSENPTAAAQGAIVIEAAQNRADLKILFEGVHCPRTFEAVHRERAALKEYGGGCHLALGISVLHSSQDQSAQTAVLCVKGQRPTGEAISEKRGSYTGPRFKSNEICLVELVQPQRNPLSYDREFLRTAAMLFITREEALPLDYTPPDTQILWTAGLKTWSKLARRGLWVHGTADSLGFEYPRLSAMGVDVNINNLLRLTHRWRQSFINQVAFATATANTTANANELTRPSGQPEVIDVATYEIEAEILPPLNRQAQLFFWKSGALAKRYFAQHSWLLEKHHATGMGDSHRTLQSLLGDRSAQLHLFLNYEECLFHFSAS